MSRECKNCGHEKEAHDLDENLRFKGKCLMRDDRCRCRKYVETEEAKG